MKRSRIKLVKKGLIISISAAIIILGLILIIGPEKSNQWFENTSQVEQSWNSQGTTAAPKIWNK